MQEFAPEQSPWRALAAAQVEEQNGLSPWWNHPTATIRRTVYVTPYSKVHRHLDELLQSLALYRDAIGQADQDQLIAALRGRIQRAGEKKEELLAWLDQARIYLAPGCRSRRSP